ncbi:MAG: Holliday junction resolvase RuvX [Ruminococcaceae bacterium]|nr:Holliday junction resolvase RuvX [Oscillospiraceae bacterium]
MRILAVDLGLQRTGVAICDEREVLASPIGTVTEHNRDRLLDKVAALAAEHRAEHLVVGHPRNMDGTRGESARRAEEFAEELAEKTGLGYTLWDERLTTVSAIGFLNETNTRGKKRKAVVDTVSAVIILQDFIDSRKKV